MSLSYFIVLLFACLLAYAGYNETMKIIIYFDLQIKLFFIEIRKKWMAYFLKRRLDKEFKNIEKFLAEHKNEQ